MDAVLPDQDRDPQPRLGDEPVGELQALGRGVQQRPRVRAEDVALDALARVELHHLAHLLREGHPGQQIGDALDNRAARVLVGVARAHRDGSSAGG
jgi:hypothetical protein